MIKLLEKAIAEVSKLPESQQEIIAQWIFDELEDEARWDKAFSESLPQLEKLGKKALEDYHAGKIQELDPDNLE